MNRDVVERTLRRAEGVNEVGVIAAPSELIAALCRRWLAVEDAPIREVEPCQQEFAPEEFKLIGTIELPAHTVGQRVRLVPEAGQGVKS